MKNITFVIACYQESPYLEKCIQSLLSQSIKCDVILVTSTPSEFLTDLAIKYTLPLKINNGLKSISGDWNFAFSCAQTQYLVIAHQDDVYFSDFATQALDFYEKNQGVGIVFSRFSELIDDKVCLHSVRLRIKNILLDLSFCLENPIKYKWQYWLLLAFGNPISCSSVVFNRRLVSNFKFLDSYQINLDWDAWYRLSQSRVPFGFIKEILSSRRIHLESTLKLATHSNKRIEEDQKIFLNFWPLPVVKLILYFYMLCY